MVLFYHLSIAAYLAALLYTHQLSENFQVKAQILLKSDDETTDGLIGQQSSGAFNAFNSYQETANQIRVLKSHQLIGEVIEKLNLKVDYFIIGRLKTTEVYNKYMPFKVMSPSLESSVKGVDFFLRVLSDSTYQLEYVIDNQEFVREFKFGEFITDNGLNFKVEGSEAIESNIENFKTLYYKFHIVGKDRMISSFQSRLQAKNIEYTSVVDLYLQDNIVERAKDFLDILGSLYLEYTLDNKKEVNEKTLQYVDLQIREVETRIGEIDAEIRVYKSQKTIVDLEMENSELQLQTRNTQEEYDESKAKFNALRELEEFLRNRSDYQLNYPPSLYLLNGNTFILDRFKEWYELQMEVLRINGEVGPDYPRLEEARQKRKSLELIILNNIEEDTRAFENKLGNLEHKLDSLRGKIKEIPIHERELMSIQRRRQGFENLYGQLLAKRAETEIAKASIIPRTKIIESPHSTGIIQPNKAEIRKRFLIAGVLFSILLTFTQVFFFDKIKTASELKAETNLPIMGEIVWEAEINQEIIDLSETNKLIRSFRNLRTNLDFVTSDIDQGKVLLITSIAQGEGKTFVAANLGKILSVANKKVVIVDLDLHRPRIHQVFESANEVGVSSVVIGQKRWDESLTIIDEHLHLISAGPISPNPSELVFDKKIEQLITTLRAEYDYVILDTPPIGPLSDALVLAKHVDTKLFVLNRKVLTKRGLYYLQKVIDSHQITQVNLILNGVRPRRKSNYFNYYGGSDYYYTS